ncbi:hypothetical protein AN958_03520 [Leucoagaricus sp. SymC.cos]|nr:hypothetical protein AN958_03520 [Leucoagaricus sp. SymC.cos]
MTNLSLPEPGNSALSAPASNAPANPATLSNSITVDAKQELEWKSSLRNLEHHMDTYKSRSRGGGDLEQEAEGVAKAMEEVAASHPDPKVKTHWRDKARAFRAASSEERDGILEEIGKGFLILLTTPFLLVGAVMQAAGGILAGVGSILKGLGRLMKKLSYTGSSKDVEEESTRPVPE